MVITKGFFYQAFLPLAYYLEMGCQNCFNKLFSWFLFNILIATSITNTQLPAPNTTPTASLSTPKSHCFFTGNTVLIIVIFFPIIE